MFTWICPQCGREVPPAYTDCPDCSKTDKAAVPVAEAGPPSAAAPSPPAAAAPPPPEYRPPQPVHPYQPPPPAQPTVGEAYVRPYEPPPGSPRGGLPAWLLTVLFAFAFLGLGVGIYWLVGYFRGSATPTATVESPAAKPGTKINPYQKYIEISGVRFLEDAKKKPQVKFVITNHSGADITGLTGNVTIWGRTRKSEEEAAGSFQFTVTIGAWESKDMTAPLTTRLQMIELPDWQNVTTDVQITGPTF